MGFYFHPIGSNGVKEERARAFVIPERLGEERAADECSTVETGGLSVLVHGTFETPLCLVGGALRPLVAQQETWQ